MGNVHPNTKVERENLAPLDRYIMDLKNTSINPDTWESLADNRPAWRHAVRQGTLQQDAHRVDVSDATGTANLKSACTATPGGVPRSILELHYGLSETEGWRRRRRMSRESSQRCYLHS
ncbi:hypothetical protein RRG08_039796 [Elysia crispata]|uniref:Uncharacterized protein n=1 Tax=Elysia crispata TaxID=231223 RepID=A0AAE1ARX3_9GAST|nr:hypothetical protein RRG08_039796 [Elysia crispata]